MIKNITKLDTLSPLKTLTRGYAIAEHNGSIVNSAKMLNAGDKIKLKFKDGQKEAKIM
jgi:exodeoxyribonuclease VII large subunit